MKNKDISKLYHVFLGSLLLSLNLYFLLFVHNKYDLSPNFALAFVTVPCGIYEIVSAMIK